MKEIKMNDQNANKSVMSGIITEIQQLFRISQTEKTKYFYQRTSTPKLTRKYFSIRHKPIQEKRSTYQQWCAELEKPPLKLNVFGLRKPIEDIISGNLIPFTKPIKSVDQNEDISLQHEEIQEKHYRMNTTEKPIEKNLNRSSFFVKLLNLISNKSKWNSKDCNSVEVTNSVKELLDTAIIEV